MTRGLLQKDLIENLRRQVRFKQDIPEGALLGASGADGGLLEAEVPSVVDAEIFATVREHALDGGYMLVDYRGYTGYAPGENVVHLFVMGALAPEVLEASQKLLDRGIYANVVVVTSPDLLIGELGRSTNYRHLTETLGIDGTLHLRTDAPLDALDAVDVAGRRAPVVSVHDGESGLLDNIGSIIGVRQVPLAVRKFSKSGTPAHIFEYHGLHADGIVETCGRALAETALERVSLSQGAVRQIQQQGGKPADWRDLWPERVES